jgi:hypothetical protein
MRTHSGEQADAASDSTRAAQEYDAMGAAYDSPSSFNDLYERPAILTLAGDVTTVFGSSMPDAPPASCPMLWYAAGHTSTRST